MRAIDPEGIAYMRLRIGFSNMSEVRSGNESHGGSQRQRKQTFFNASTRGLLVEFEFFLEWWLQMKIFYTFKRSCYYLDCTHRHSNIVLLLGFHRFYLTIRGRCLAGVWLRGGGNLSRPLSNRVGFKEVQMMTHENLK